MLVAGKMDEEKLSRRRRGKKRETMERDQGERFLQIKDEVESWRVVRWEEKMIKMKK